VLEVEGLSAPGVIENVSLTVREGEILGLFGLMGSGRSELARILMGLDPHSRGAPACWAAPHRRPARARRARPRLRDREPARGGADDGRLDPRQPRASRHRALPRHRGLDQGDDRDAAQALREVVASRRATSNRQPVRSLSGGNQQKVVIGKWLPTEPAPLHPGRAHARRGRGRQVRDLRLMDRLAAGGAGLLVISSELDELMGCATASR
jgi:ABC-type sugar transport system ATPase subunit